MYLKEVIDEYCVWPATAEGKLWIPRLTETERMKRADAKIAQVEQAIREKEEREEKEKEEKKLWEKNMNQGQTNPTNGTNSTKKEEESGNVRLIIGKILENGGYLPTHQMKQLCVHLRVNYEKVLDTLKMILICPQDRVFQKRPSISTSSSSSSSYPSSGGGGGRGDRNSNSNIKLYEAALEKLRGKEGVEIAEILAPEFEEALRHCLQAGGGTATITELHEWCRQKEVLMGSVTIQMVKKACLALRDTVVYLPDTVWVQAIFENIVEVYEYVTCQFFSFAPDSAREERIPFFLMHRHTPVVDAKKEEEGKKEGEEEKKEGEKKDEKEEEKEGEKKDEKNDEKEGEKKDAKEEEKEDSKGKEKEKKEEKTDAKEEEKEGAKDDKDDDEESDESDDDQSESSEDFEMIVGPASKKQKREEVPTSTTTKPTTPTPTPTPTSAHMANAANIDPEILADMPVWLEADALVYRKRGECDCRLVDGEIHLENGHSSGNFIVKIIEERNGGEEEVVFASLSELVPLECGVGDVVRVVNPVHQNYGENGVVHSFSGRNAVLLPADAHIGGVVNMANANKKLFMHVLKRDIVRVKPTSTHAGGISSEETTIITTTILSEEGVIS